MIVVLVGLLGGVAVAFQVPLAGIITQRMGMLESAFLVHLGGALTAALPLAFLAGGRLGEWRAVPAWAFLAGSFGIIVISAVTFAIPRIGVAPALTLLIVGQIIIGALLDHYGFLVETIRPMDATRLLGLLLLITATWLIVR
jgi:transporter family-2 protein